VASVGDVAVEFIRANEPKGRQTRPTPPLANMVMGESASTLCPKEEPHDSKCHINIPTSPSLTFPLHCQEEVV